MVRTRSIDAAGNSKTPMPGKFVTVLAQVEILDSFDATGGKALVPV